MTCHACAECSQSGVMEMCTLATSGGILVKVAPQLVWNNGPFLFEILYKHTISTRLSMLSLCCDASEFMIYTDEAEMAPTEIRSL